MNPELEAQLAAALAQLALLAIKQLGPPTIKLIETFVTNVESRLANPPTDLPPLEDTLIQKAVDNVKAHTP